MARPQIVDDTFERLLEVGQTTASQTKKAVTSVAKQTVREVSAGVSTPGVETPGVEARKNGKNHTPLGEEEMKRLEGIYEGQDEQKMGAVRQKLMTHFQDFKREERRAGEQTKQKAEQRKQAFQQEEEREKQEEEEKKKQAYVTAPKGKVRRNILQRSIKSSQPETRVGGGK